MTSCYCKGINGDLFHYLYIPTPRTELLWAQVSNSAPVQPSIHASVSSLSACPCSAILGCAWLHSYIVTNADGLDRKKSCLKNNTSPSLWVLCCSSIQEEKPLLLSANCRPDLHPDWQELGAQDKNCICLLSGMQHTACLDLNVSQEIGFLCSLTLPGEHKGLRQLAHVLPKGSILCVLLTLC